MKEKAALLSVSDLRGLNGFTTKLLDLTKFTRLIVNHDKKVIEASNERGWWCFSLKGGASIIECLG